MWPPLQAPQVGVGDDRAGLHQRLDVAGLERLAVDLLRARRDQEAHARRDLPPVEHAGGDFEIVELAVGAGADEGLSMLSPATSRTGTALFNSVSGIATRISTLPRSSVRRAA